MENQHFTPHTRDIQKSSNITEEKTREKERKKRFLLTFCWEHMGLRGLC